MPTSTRSTPTALTAEMGLRIKEARRALGMSQAELARRLGYLHGASIIYIERGQNIMPPDKFVKLCKELRVSPNELLGWSK